jgi:protein-S-isoprenylcysteine O-methyltransferase Ste14
MQKYFAVATFVLMIGMVIFRVVSLKKLGIDAFKFAKLDKKDLLIPPFAFLYFYLILAHTFEFPSISSYMIIKNEIIEWIGVALCLFGLTLLVVSIIHFKNSFRVGIDTKSAGRLITTGVFSISRNPIYVSFGVILAGQFLIYSNPILLAYVFLGTWLFNRQVILEESYLKQRYGEEYKLYCKKVRRYL